MADLGEDVEIQLTVIDTDGDPYDPTTVAIVVTAPDDTTSSPPISNPAIGDYRATRLGDQVGRWRVTWTTTGPAGVEHDHFDVDGAPPGARLDPLATLADLERDLGRELTDTEAAEAPALIAKASTSVRSFCRRDFAYVENDSVKLRPTHDQIRLPNRPVVSITSVAPIQLDGTAGDPLDAGYGYYFDGIDTLTVRRWFQAYQIVYTHGDPTGPPQVATDVVLGMVRRVLDSPVSTEAITQVTVGQYTEQYQQAQGSPGRTPRLTKADERTLIRAGLCTTAGTIQTVAG